MVLILSLFDSSGILSDLNSDEALNSASCADHSLDITGILCFICLFVSSFNHIKHGWLCSIRKNWEYETKLILHAAEKQSFPA